MVAEYVSFSIADEELSSETPSDADIAMTRTVEEAARALSITLHDHLIVGRSDEFSFRSAGYL